MDRDPGSEEPINEAVREHETTADWTFREKAKLLHWAFPILNEAFFGGGLPTPCIQISPARRRNLGHYRPGRNGIGALYEINLNAQNMERSDFELLATLAHEMVHQWQDVSGKRPRTNWHNAEFYWKCRSIGIFTERGRGYHVGYGEPFVALLEAHGIPYEPERLGDESLHRRRNQSTSKLKKWRCHCTNLWAAVEIAAVCLKCEEQFHREICP
jgi:hypothetical protein